MRTWRGQRFGAYQRTMPAGAPATSWPRTTPPAKGLASITGWYREAIHGWWLDRPASGAVPAPCPGLDRRSGPARARRVPVADAGGARLSRRAGWRRQFTGRAPRGTLWIVME